MDWFEYWVYGDSSFEKLKVILKNSCYESKTIVFSDFVYEN